MSHQSQKYLSTKILSLALSGVLVAPLASAQVNQKALFEAMMAIEMKDKNSSSLQTNEYSSLSAPESLSIRPYARPSDLNIHPTNDSQEDEAMFVDFREQDQSRSQSNTSSSQYAPASIGIRPEVRPEGLASNGSAFGPASHDQFEQIESASIPNEPETSSSRRINPFTGEVIDNSPVQQQASQEAPATQQETPIQDTPTLSYPETIPPVIYTPPEPGSNIAVHPAYKGRQCVAGNVQDLLQSPSLYREVQETMNLHDISELYTDTQFWREHHSFRILPDIHGRGLYIHEDGENNRRPVNADGSLTYYKVQEICLNKGDGQSHLTISFTLPNGRKGSFDIHPTGTGSRDKAYQVVAGGQTTTAQLITTSKYESIRSSNNIRNVIGNIFTGGSRRQGVN